MKSVTDSRVEGRPQGWQPCLGNHQRVSVPGSNHGVADVLVRVIHDRYNALSNGSDT